MTFLRLYGREVTSFFQLMGTSENDITISLAWVLSNCPVLLNSVVRSICHVRKVDFNNVEIACQEYESNKGFTDIEIRDDNSFHIIIEAKRGWNLPGKAQITKYAKRRSFARSKIENKYIVTLSECTQKYAAKHIPDNAGNGIPVVHRSYQDILNMANQSYSESNNAEKRMLSQFCQYMRGWMTMQTIESNMVYVVSLSKDYADGCDLTYIDIVEKKHKYFHPFDYRGWPKEPPNYIAFRYGGKLQSIHHIEKYVVTSNLHDEIKEMPDVEEDWDYFVYRLGPAIRPQKEVRTGNIYRNGKVWAMLDTLLTCDTISEARDLTKRRKQQEV